MSWIVNEPFRGQSTSKRGLVQVVFYVRIGIMNYVRINK